MTRAKGERTDARRTGKVMRLEHAVSVLSFCWASRVPARIARTPCSIPTS